MSLIHFTSLNSSSARRPSLVVVASSSNLCRKRGNFSFAYSSLRLLSSTNVAGSNQQSKNGNMYRIHSYSFMYKTNEIEEWDQEKTVEDTLISCCRFMNWEGGGRGWIALALVSMTLHVHDRRRSASLAGSRSSFRLQRTGSPLLSIYFRTYAL